MFYINFLKYLFLFLFTQSLFSQIDPNSLLGLPQLNTVDRISVTPIAGNLVFDTDFQKVFEFNGTQWKQLLEAPIVIPLTGDYTATLQDNGNILTFNSPTDVVLTMPAGLPEGYNLSIYQIGAGKVQFVGAGSVQVKNRLNRFFTAGLDAGAGIVATGTDIFHLTGDLRTMNISTTTPTGTPSASVALDNFQDGNGNAPYSLILRNTTNSPIANYEVLVSNVPYGTIPGLVLGNHTVAISSNPNGTFNYLFTSTVALPAFGSRTINGGVPVPSGTGSACGCVSFFTF